MTSMPASRNARAMTLAPRSWPSRPGFAINTRIRFSGMVGFLLLLRELCVLCVKRNIGTLLRHNESPHAVFQDRNVEVDEQGDRTTRESQINQDDCLVNWPQGIDRLEFYNDPFFN